MGTLLVKEVLASTPQLYLSGGITRDKIKAPLDVPLLKDAEDLFASSDIVIDFTSPEASVLHARIAARTGKPLVIGTTGFSESERAEIAGLGNSVAILLTPNASLGVNVLLDLVRKTASFLGPDFAIEILEAHHGQKQDAPSGTALALAQSASEGRGIDLRGAAVYSRHGRTGPRTEGEIGFSVLRGGDIVGEHTVYFIGQGERIELTHRATDRAIFARGALRAAQWLAEQEAGFYTMADFLRLV